jgi:uncharacterized protein (DUF1778 family)
MDISTATRSDRIDVRTNTEVKSLIERAATLSHKSISAYIIESALRKAQEDINEAETVTLSTAEREAFFAALINPPEPNASLKALFNGSSKVVSE